MSNLIREFIEDEAVCSCGNSKLYHIDKGDEEDSEGTFGNHVICCPDCGRCTTDMDTKEDAIEAFCDQYNKDLLYKGKQSLYLDEYDCKAFLTLLHEGYLTELDIRRAFEYAHRETLANIIMELEDKQVVYPTAAKSIR